MAHSLQYTLAMPRVMESLIPTDVTDLTISVKKREVHLTHLDKMFWPKLKLTKGDLLRYYEKIAPFILPHILERPMVLKRYPNGSQGEFFYMKSAPEPHPAWLKTCGIEHPNSGLVPYPLVDDLASLLWLVNLGCIDLNPWYARCPSFDHPEYLHFDLDPVAGVPFSRVREVALRVRDHLERLDMPTYVKTTGATGMHVYVPIRDNHIQKDVWYVAKAVAVDLARKFPKIITSEYLIAKRPKGTVLVDYNQNSWGKTLASIYSPRAVPDACVSAPVTWKEVESGVDRRDFTLMNMPGHLKERGDLWKSILGKKRYDLSPLISVTKKVA